MTTTIVKNSKIIANMYLDLFKTPIEQRAEWLKNIWKEKKGYDLDLMHPRTSTEKFQWYKLYYDPDFLWRCLDKIEFKSYVNEKLSSDKDVYTAKLLRVFNSPEEVNLSDLPKQFVIKSNCRDNGKWIKIVRDRDAENLKEIESMVATQWFDIQQTLVNSFCTGYHHVKPRVFVEEFLNCMDEVPIEYKFFCFDGQPQCVYSSKEHFKSVDGQLENDMYGYPISFYDLNWRRIDVLVGNYNPFYDAPKPKHFEDMLSIAKKLSEKIPFVRVDFFETTDHFYLSEMTFYPGGGYTNYQPSNF